MMVRGDPEEGFYRLCVCVCGWMDKPLNFSSGVRLQVKLFRFPEKNLIQLPLVFFPPSQNLFYPPLETACDVLHRATADCVTLTADERRDRTCRD